MKRLSFITVVVLVGAVALVVPNAPAATTKKKVTDKVPATTVDTKPPITTNETWTPKTNRQPAPTQTPATTKTPVTPKTPTTTKTPEPKKSVTPQKPVVLGHKLKNNMVSNPQPKLPDAARKANVSGPVRVEVTVDEKGNVLSAKPISGNTLLHQAAVESAKKAKFKPTQLSGTSVKVTGIISYNFVQ